MITLNINGVIGGKIHHFLLIRVARLLIVLRNFIVNAWMNAHNSVGKMVLIHRFRTIRFYLITSLEEYRVIPRVQQWPSMRRLVSYH